MGHKLNHQAHKVSTICPRALLTLTIKITSHTFFGGSIIFKLLFQSEIWYPHLIYLNSQISLFLASFCRDNKPCLTESIGNIDRFIHNSSTKCTQIYNQKEKSMTNTLYREKYNASCTTWIYHNCRRYTYTIGLTI